MKLIIKETTGSTNDDIKRLTDEEEFTAVLAFRQTDGRGSKGKKFVSPYGGAYFSVIFYPDKELLPLVTPMAAVAAREAIFDMFGIECGIKWINDLYYNGKKVCGILTECRSVGEKNLCVIGVGVNVFRASEGYGDCDDTAGYLSENKADRQAITNFVVKAVELIKNKAHSRVFMADYARYSIHNGKFCFYSDGEKRQKVLVEGVTAEGRLNLVFPDGSKKTVDRGTITLCSDEDGQSFCQEGVGFVI